MDLIYSYTIEDGLKDGAFVEITETVKSLIKWRTVLSEGLHAKVLQLNEKFGQDAIDCVIMDIATMFRIEAKKNGKNSGCLSFKCILRADLKGEAENLCAGINMSQENEPVLIFYFPSEH